MSEYKIRFNLSNFLRDIKLKKQYLAVLKNKVNDLKITQNVNYKAIDKTLLPSVRNQNRLEQDHMIMYILHISFSKTNTFFHVLKYDGTLKFFCSAGLLGYTGKSKKARSVVFKSFYRILTTKLRFLKGKPIAVHFKNVGFNKVWMLKKLKKKFFIKVVRNFNLYPHNGCRKPKVRRKKIRTKRRK